MQHLKVPNQSHFSQPTIFVNDSGELSDQGVYCTQLNNLVVSLQKQLELTSKIHTGFIESFNKLQSFSSDTIKKIDYDKKEYDLQRTQQMKIDQLNDEYKKHELSTVEGVIKKYNKTAIDTDKYQKLVKD